MRFSNTLPFALTSSVVAATISEAAVVSANFRQDGSANQLIASGTVAGGGAGVGASNWNDAEGASGSLDDLEDDAGSATTVDISWNASGAWGDSSADTDATDGVGDAQLQRGYLDDGGGTSASITLSQVPYALYDVVLYFSTDTTEGSYAPFEVTDANGTESGSTTGTKLLWGENPNLDETNSARVSGLTGDASIQVAPRDGDIRGSLSGIQIIQVPEPATTTFAGLAGVLLLARRRRG